MERPVYKILTFNGEETSVIGSEKWNGEIVWGAGGSAIVETHSLRLRSIGHKVASLATKSEGIALDEGSDILESDLNWATSIDYLSANQRFVNNILNAANVTDIMYVSHPRAGVVISLLKDSGLIEQDKKFVYVGQSWGRMIEEAVPGWRTFPERDKAEQLILQSADKVVAYTNAEKEIVSRLYGINSQESDKQFRIVPLGVDQDVFNPVNRSHVKLSLRSEYLEELSDSLNFFMLARIAPQKGQRLAIEAFHKSLIENPGLNISLSLFGEPPRNSKSVYKREYYLDL